MQKKPRRRRRFTPARPRAPRAFEASAQHAGRGTLPAATPATQYVVATGVGSAAAVGCPVVVTVGHPHLRGRRKGSWETWRNRESFRRQVGKAIAGVKATGEYPSEARTVSYINAHPELELMDRPRYGELSLRHFHRFWRKNMNYPRWHALLDDLGN